MCSKGSVTGIRSAIIVGAGEEPMGVCASALASDLEVAAGQQSQQLGR